MVVALDWTEFDKDDQATLAMYLVTSHGRATPLLWKTVQKSGLKNRRNDYEAELIERLHQILPETVNVTLLADRGFGDQKLFIYSVWACPQLTSTRRSVATAFSCWPRTRTLWSAYFYLCSSFGW